MLFNNVQYNVTALQYSFVVCIISYEILMITRKQSSFFAKIKS